MRENYQRYLSKGIQRNYFFISTANKQQKLILFLDIIGTKQKKLMRSIKILILIYFLFQVSVKDTFSFRMYMIKSFSPLAENIESMKNSIRSQKSGKI